MEKYKRKSRASLQAAQLIMHITRGASRPVPAGRLFIGTPRAQPPPRPHPQRRSDGAVAGRRELVRHVRRALELVAS